jgi:exosortase A-associated hydrolase 2
MNGSRRNSPAEPFFLAAGTGQRFCLYHAPAPDISCRGGFIYVHPFAEEMNKSRRMAALQARALAGAGFGVLQIDLYGCGDSSGDFGDARWEIWKDDLLIASKWLEDRTGGATSLWGLRLGGLLALDFAMDAMDAKRPVAQLVLWQPVLNGETYLTQFLRMRLAGDMLVDSAEKATGTKGMREAMAAGKTIEVAGYALAPALAASIDNLNATNLAIPNVPVNWFELVAEPGRPLPPAAVRTASAWEQRGVELHLHPVPGIPFWASQEISECVPLVDATTNLFNEVVS